MQTTLRITDAIYREAKAEAAREGQTLTRFIEDGIRLRLRTVQAPRTHSFRVIRGAPRISDEEISQIASEDQTAYDLRKLGIPLKKSRCKKSR